MSEYETPASVLLKNLVESPYYRLLSSQLDDRQRCLIAQLLGDNTEFLVSGIATLLDVPKVRPRGNDDLPNHPSHVTLEVEVACIIRDHNLGYLSLLEIGISTNRARIIDAIPWTSINKVTQINNRIISFNKSEDSSMSLSFSFESEAATFYRALKLADPERVASQHEQIELPTVKSEVSVDLPPKKLKPHKSIIRRIFTKSKKSDRTERVHRKSADSADSDGVINIAGNITSIPSEIDNEKETGPVPNDLIVSGSEDKGVEQADILRKAAEAKDEEMRAMRQRVAELEAEAERKERVAIENERIRAEEADRKEQIAIENERKRYEAEKLERFALEKKRIEEEENERRRVQEATRKEQEERNRRDRQEKEKKQATVMCNFCGIAVATVSFTCGHRSCKACSVVTIKSPVGFNCDAEICRECTTNVARNFTNFFSNLGIS